MDYLILSPVVLPIITGIVLLLLPQKVFKNRKALLITAGISVVVSTCLTLFIISGVVGSSVGLFCIVDDIRIYFNIDDTGRLFAATAAVIFVLTGFFSFGYMAHEKNEKRYYAYYLMTFGVLVGLCFSGNLVTMYMFYEFMTIVSVPLVLHSGSREAVMAGLKYLIYSFCGSYMALFGIYCLYRYTDTLDFVGHGTLRADELVQSGNVQLMLAASFLMILGFGVKAGMFPMHAWLCAAHPAAPAPASAFLSGIIVKGGILAVIRTVFYCIGSDFLRGTWVQTLWILLASITVIMGSALAYKERMLKKRLAYSTISNLSYIMLGLAFLSESGFRGSLLHVVFHAVIKTALFMFAGSVIFVTGKVRVNDLAGLGKKMPMLFRAYTIAALGLTGIPPMSGFVSKWYIGLGGFSSDIPVFSRLGVVALIISALLTAGYLLPISVKGFLADENNGSMALHYKEPPRIMLVPVIVLAAATLVLGIFPVPLVEFINGIILDCFL